MNKNFKNNVNELVNTLINYYATSFTVKEQKAKFTSLDREVATSEIRFNYNNTSNDEIVSTLLNNVKSNPYFENVKEITHKNKVTFTYKGLEVSAIVTQYTSLFELSILCVGEEVKVETEFETFPEFKPGAILHSEYSYSCVFNLFYKVLKRSGNTVYFIELKKNRYSSNGFQGEETPNLETEIDYSQVRRARIQNSSIKINRYLTASIWDGSKYFDILD